MTFNGWAPMLFGLLASAIINIPYSIPQIGAPLYNYSLGLISVTSFATSLLLSGIGLKFIKRVGE
jgi:hypothetical protein